jgi:Uma2 family endonuclease
MLGLADHNQPVTVKEFETADFEPGYKYELIDGRLYVTYEPNLPEDYLANWVRGQLLIYGASRPDVINYVTAKARVFVPGRRRTVPEPDVAAYRNFPHSIDVSEMNWRHVTPLLVVEVMYLADPFKDLIRNVKLYGKVPGIREYWIIDARNGASQPDLLVYRRRGTTWMRQRLIAFGDIYTTPLLPGFRLVVDPRR